MTGNGVKVTYDDIARRAGVSKMTVSRVLRGNSHVSSELAERVQHAVKELGYVPNPLISAFMGSLRRKAAQVDHGTMAFLSHVPEPDLEYRPWEALAIEGARQRAKLFGYRFDYFHVDEDALNWERVREVLVSRGVVGVLLCYLHPAPPENFDWTPFSVAALGRDTQSLQVSHVVLDHYSNMRNVLQKLEARGHRRIVFVCAEMLRGQFDGRYHAAYFEHFAEKTALGQPLEILEPPVGPGASRELLLKSYENVLQRARALKADAIVDLSPSGRHWLTEVGAGIPEEFSFAALELLPDEPDSGVRSDYRAVGAMGFDLVHEQIQRSVFGPPAIAQRITVSGGWNGGITLRPDTSSPVGNEGEP